MGQGAKKGKIGHGVPGASVMEDKERGLQCGSSEWGQVNGGEQTVAPLEPAQVSGLSLIPLCQNNSCPLSTAIQWSLDPRTSTGTEQLAAWTRHIESGI